jgi:hypothetical protein
MLIQTLPALCLIAALAQDPLALSRVEGPPQQPSYQAPKARRHFISLTFDTQFLQPYSFNKHPLEDLLGQPVDEVHLETFQYRTRDGKTLVNVLEYGKRASGIGATVYPFGSSVGATLAVRGSIESVPPIRVAFTGPAPSPTYELTNGRATDVGIGIDMSDRSAGWGLGAHAFVMGGIGKITTDQLDGSRYFGEGGGGITSGPFGVDISLKFSVNKFDTPVPHRIYLIPISVRGTLTF